MSPTRLLGFLLVIPVVFCSTLKWTPASQWKNPSKSRDWLLHDSAQTTESIPLDKDTGVALDNSLVYIGFSFVPDFFRINFYSYEKKSSLTRAVDPAAVIALDDLTYDIGGVITDTPRAYMNYTHLSNNLAANPNAFHYQSYNISQPVAPVKYSPRRHAPSDIKWPPNGLRLDVTFVAPSTAIERHRDIKVVVTYEVYDGLPFVAKWVTVHPGAQQKPPVEASIYSVEYLAVNQQWAPSGYGWLLTDTDVAHSSVVKWGNDPSAGAMPGSFQPVVNCSYSNHFRVPLVEPFASFRVRHLLVGSGDMERQGLAKRKLLRLLAPWTQESPIFFHMVPNPAMTVYDVIDQLVEVGFEMLIYSFGSGFDMESTNETYINEIAKVVKYANQRGIEVGGYDLIALTRTPPKPYQQFEATDPQTGKPIGSTCFASGWYDHLLDTFLSFMNKTGLSNVETDGPYGGYACGSKNHSHHRDASDSVYWQTLYQGRFYTALQERSVYINQPDNFFYQGGSETGMGYNENQYSLPRWQDISVSRQGMFDDLYHYIPTVGWMFVPLVQYHGGGSAATIEPLATNIKAYEWALAQYLGAGVKACYRGYRVYDTNETKSVVQKWVTFYKKYRDILSSDVIHVRRPDMQGIDCFMHVNPNLATRGLAMVFNPTDHNIDTYLTLPLYYTGLDNEAKISEKGVGPINYIINRDYTVELDISLKALGITWFVIS